MTDHATTHAVTFVSVHVTEHAGDPAVDQAARRCATDLSFHFDSYTNTSSVFNSLFAPDFQPHRRVELEGLAT